jgi:hypothetical protein
MRILPVVIMALAWQPVLSQKNGIMNFGPGLNVLTEGGNKLNWSIGMRMYAQFANSSFFAGGVDYNRFTSKVGSLKTHFTIFRIGYEYFNEKQTFHIGADVGSALQSGDLGEDDVNTIFSIGPGIMSRREKKAIWDASIRYNYITNTGWDWIGIRVGFGFREEIKRRRRR